MLFPVDLTPVAAATLYLALKYKLFLKRAGLGGDNHLWGKKRICQEQKKSDSQHTFYFVVEK